MLTDNRVARKEDGSGEESKKVSQENRTRITYDLKKGGEKRKLCVRGWGGGGIQQREENKNKKKVRSH